MSYKAEILADSINLQGDRITTMKITFPRMMLAEMNTHRMFSRNSASSRAIPFKKMVKMIEENPFIPIAFQKPHSGMQGTEYYDHNFKEGSGGLDYTNLTRRWLRARDTAVSMAKIMADKTLNMPVTKQLCNRLLEPFMWHTVIVTATEWENFFKLRCPEYEIFYMDTSEGLPGREIFKSYRSRKDWSKENYQDDMDNWTDTEWLQINKSQADIHIQAIAELMWDAMNESDPKELEAGQWHIPFGDNFDEYKIGELVDKDHPIQPASLSWHQEACEDYKRKVAIARCARISYQTLGDNPTVDYEKDLKLYNILAESGHWSPFEHVARAMSYSEYDTYLQGKISDRRQSADLTREEAKRVTGWCRNFRGFIQYRSLTDKK